MAFQFEKLEVYQKSLNLVEVVEYLSEQLKDKVSCSLLDQLSRAALSIPLNIAEGNGRWHKGEKRQFFWIVCGSAFECVPILQVMRRKQFIDEQAYAVYYEQLDVIAKMITNLVKSVEDLRK